MQEITCSLSFIHLCDLSSYTREILSAIAYLQVRLLYETMWERVPTHYTRTLAYLSVRWFTVFIMLLCRFVWFFSNLINNKMITVQSQTLFAIVFFVDCLIRSPQPIQPSALEHKPKALIIWCKIPVLLYASIFLVSQQFLNVYWF